MFISDSDFNGYIERRVTYSEKEALAHADKANEELPHKGSHHSMECYLKGMASAYRLVAEQLPDLTNNPGFLYDFAVHVDDAVDKVHCLVANDEAPASVLLEVLVELQEKAMTAINRTKGGDK